MAIDYAQFLSRHDMVWDCFPDTWEDAPFLGNGMLGSMFYRKTPFSLRIDIGHSLVYDHRETGDKHDMLFNRCRLPANRPFCSNIPGYTRKL